MMTGGAGRARRFDGRRAMHLLIACLALVAAEEPPAIPVQPGDRYERFDGDLISGFYNMYQPDVVEVPGADYRYRMWFFGWAADASNSPGMSRAPGARHPAGRPPVAPRVLQQPARGIADRGSYDFRHDRIRAKRRPWGE
jgi:hypothetical protein